MKKNNQEKTQLRARTEASTRKKTFIYYGEDTKGLPVSKSVGKRARVVSDQSLSGKASWWKYLPSFLAVAAILFCVIYELLLSSAPRVVILNDVPNVFSNSPILYQHYAQELFNKSLYQRNKLTVNTSEIDLEMQKEFPEIANVSITLPLLGNRPTVYIQPDTAVLVMQNQESGDLAIDANGKVIAETSKLSSLQKLGLPLVVYQSNLVVKPGDEALSVGDVNFIQLVLAQLKAADITVSSLVIPPQSRELDVYMSGSLYFVKFNLDDAKDVKQQIGTFLSARQYLVTNKINPTTYIDARVLGRVYYK